MKRILVVEDDIGIRKAVSDELEAQGWGVDSAMDGELGLQMALDNKYDCLVLDLMLPRIHGYEICKSVRLARKDVPILMMSAKGKEGDVLKGFQVGATDYIRKPFSLAELVMRVKVHIGSEDDRLVKRSGYLLDSSLRRLKRPNATKVTLTEKEAGVLLLLMSKRNQVLSRVTLLNAVWGNHWSLGERSVDRCIKTLRKKLIYDAEQHSPIRTVRNSGYTWSD